MSKAVKRKGKRIMWIAIIVVVVLGGVAVGGLMVDGPGRREIAELSISSMDFKNLRDGTYIGEYQGTKSHIRDTKVEVTIKGGKIANIKILKGALDKDGNPSKLKDGKGIGDIYDNVIKSETLQVDVVSGATITSKTHLKALENALKQAQK